jgi:hypothetical protein
MELEDVSPADLFVVLDHVSSACGVTAPYDLELVAQSWA